MILLQVNPKDVTRLFVIFTNSLTAKEAASTYTVHLNRNGLNSAKHTSLPQNCYIYIKKPKYKFFHQLPYQILRIYSTKLSKAKLISRFKLVSPQK